jgi:ABC-type dipeptide/oligopeptide/nickel transport system ATPase subunit
MEIYKDIVNFYKGFKFKGKLGLPIQQILNTFLPYLSIGILPLKYNFQYHPYISAKCVVVTKEQVKEAQENEEYIRKIEKQFKKDRTDAKAKLKEMTEAYYGMG